MRKLLTILGTVTLIGTTSTNVIACGSSDQANIEKINIANKIPNTINLGQLSTTNKSDFLVKLQSKLVTLTDLSSITTNDYDVYQAGSTNSITNSDITAGTSLNIKIVAKGDSFTGIKDNITTKYSSTIRQQDTIYLDNNGKQQITNERNLSDWDIKEIMQIGFYQNNNGEIQAVKMPRTITKVPNELPSSITNISNMFAGCSAFNQNIANWNTVNVTDMSYMFAGTSVFNQKIAKWNTTNVTNMSHMFAFASAFNQDISTWNTTNVTDMSAMFADTLVFNQNISNWDVANVIDMSHMFYNANAFNQNIGNWDVANVTNMSYMFFNARAFNQNLSLWNVVKVANHANFAEDSGFANDTNKWPTFS